MASEAAPEAVAVGGDGRPRGRGGTEGAEDEGGGGRLNNLMRDATW